MTQKIILSLFTFWLGVSGTLAVPLSLFGAGFKLTAVEKVYAEAAPPPASDAQASTCRFLVSDVATKKSTAAQALSTLRTTRQSADKEVMDDLVGDNGKLRRVAREVGVVLNADLRDQELKKRAAAYSLESMNRTHQRVVNRANVFTRDAIQAYYSSVNSLGDTKCNEYASEASQYNQTANTFNGILESANQQRTLWPTDKAAAIKARILQALSSFDTQVTIAKGSIEGIDTFLNDPSLNLTLASVRLLNVSDPTANDPDVNNPDGSTGGVTVDSNNFGSGANDCGLTNLKSSGKGPIVDIFNSVVKTMFGLACIALNAMHDLMALLVTTTDCLLSGEEIPALCDKAEQQSQRAVEPAPTLDTSEDEIPTVDDEGIPNSIPPPTTNSPGTSPPIFQDTSPFPS